MHILKARWYYIFSELGKNSFMIKTMIYEYANNNNNINRL
jgi:hypothetical protein